MPDGSPARLPTVPVAAARLVTAGVRVLAGRRRWPGVAPGAARAERVAVPTAARPDAGALVVSPMIHRSAGHHADASGADLPVVCFLHGWPDAPESALAAGLARTVTGSRRWPPFVLVLPDGTGWSRGDHEWADAADGADGGAGAGDLLETWLVDAVLPAVEGDRPRTPGRRALAGFSMGGYGALNVGLRRPGVFGALGSISGYFVVDDPEGVFGGDEALEASNAPLQVARAAADAGADAFCGLRVALVASDHEGALTADQVAPMARALHAGGADVLAQVRPGRHSWRCAAQRWPDVLAHLAAGWG